MRDIVNNVGFVQALAPQVLAATLNGPSLDLSGFDSAALVITTGEVAGSGNFTAKLQESDDGSNWSDVPPARLNGALASPLAANGCVKIGYAGWARYLRPVFTKNSGTSIALAAILVKGHPAKQPVA